MHGAAIPETMAILRPMVALAGWTMVMWLWLYATRIPVIGAARPADGPWIGGTGKDLDAVLPEKIQWKAHNYNHLHEAPTVFYAMSLLLAVIGQGGGINAAIAWVYVGLRVIHSLWQATVNGVVIRFSLFVLSSLALLALVLHAGMAMF